MKKLLIITASVLFFFTGFAQDISFYHRRLNDEFTMPRTQWGMTAGEFQLLSRNVRLMDWFYGAAVPGYVHFRAKDNAAGYALLSTRLIGYGGLAYVMTSSKSSLAEIFKGNFGEGDDAQTLKYISEASLVLVVGSYLFDMIHGNYRLKRKQELIRYKYSTKLIFSTAKSPLSLRYDPRQSFLFGLSMTF